MEGDIGVGANNFEPTVSSKKEDKQQSPDIRKDFREVWIWDTVSVE